MRGSARQLAKRPSSGQGITSGNDGNKDDDEVEEFTSPAQMRVSWPGPPRT